jgi:hypothetical protein
MKSKILVNRNEIISETTYSAYYPKLSGKYAFNVVFSGEADYTVEKRNITLVPDSFIFLNYDTCYTNKIDSAVEVRPFQFFLIPVLFMTLNILTCLKITYCWMIPRSSGRGIRVWWNRYTLCREISSLISCTLQSMSKMG